MRDHTKLKVFRLADALPMEIYKVTRHFPRDERFGLTAQLRRAAVSIGANIAEGSTRVSDVEFARFLEIAYGSARELDFELSLAVRLNYMPAPRYRRALDLSSQTCRALRAFIAAFKRN